MADKAPDIDLTIDFKETKCAICGKRHNEIFFQHPDGTFSYGICCQCATLMDRKDEDNASE